MRAQTSNVPLVSVHPITALSLEERRRFRSDSIEALIQRGVGVKRIGAGTQEVIIRDILPQLDLAVARAGAGAAAQEWVIDVAITGPGAAAPDIWINAALPAQRAMVIYGVFCTDATPILSHVWLRTGPAANTKGLAQLEPLYAVLETIGYLTKAVLWDPLETVRIDIMGIAASAADLRRFGFLGYILEPVGEIISGPAI